MTTMARLWSGEIPPREIFWAWLIARGLVLNLACTIAALVLVATAPADSVGWLWLAAAVHLAAVPFNVICLMGLWRGLDRQDPADPGGWMLRLGALAVVAAYLVL
jgi:hypothetical protein